MTNYKDKILHSIECANNNITKLNDKALSLPGMSSNKVRIFLNTILEDTSSKYLEIGVWKGSTFYSALYGNNPSYAVAIDNFSEFAGSSKAFLANMSDITTPYLFINGNCFSLDTTAFTDTFNIYFYDGNHKYESQKKAITNYYDRLDDEFIYICDDWNFPDVPKGTMRGIEESNLKIIEQWLLPASHNGDTINWWNGLWVAILQKA